MADDKSTNFKVKKDYGRGDICFSMARVPGSGRCYFGSSDGGVYDIDLGRDKPETKRCEGEGHSSYVTGTTLTEKHIITGAWDRHLIWWDRETGKLVRRQKAHDRWLRGVEASPDGKLIASVADDMVCRLWDAYTGKLVRELRGHKDQTPHNYPSMLFCAVFSSDGSKLATADKPGRIVIWDVKSGKQLKTCESPGMYTWDPKQRRHSIGGVRSLRFSPEGKMLTAGGIGQIGNIDHLGSKARLEFFDWEKGKSLKVLEAGDKFKGLVEHMEYHPENKWLLAGGGDHGGWLLFIDPAAMKITRQKKAPMHIHEFNLSEKADTLYAVGHNKLARWELEPEKKEAS
jgi:WD40 repeat protein